MRVLLTFAALLAYSTVSHADWTYRSLKDRMTGHSIRLADLQSKNTVNLRFPYQGTQRATLTLRQHPESGLNVTVSVPRSQILCRDCELRVRFDEGDVKTYPTATPADMSSNILFIENEAWFVKHLLDSQRLRIEVPFYRDGTHVFDFDVRRLKWDDPYPELEAFSLERRAELRRSCDTKADAAKALGQPRRVFMRQCFKDESGS